MALKYHFLPIGKPTLPYLSINPVYRQLIQSNLTAQSRCGSDTADHRFFPPPLHTH